MSGDADESSDAQGRSAAADGPFLMCFDKLEDFASTVQQLPLAVQLVQVTLTPETRPWPLFSNPQPGGDRECCRWELGIKTDCI